MVSWGKGSWIALVGSILTPAFAAVVSAIQNGVTDWRTLAAMAATAVFSAILHANRASQANALAKSGEADPSFDESA